MYDFSLRYSFLYLFTFILLLLCKLVFSFCVYYIFFSIQPFIFLFTKILLRFHYPNFFFILLFNYFLMVIELKWSESVFWHNTTNDYGSFSRFDILKKAYAMKPMYVSLIQSIMKILYKVVYIDEVRYIFSIM